MEPTTPANEPSTAILFAKPLELVDVACEFAVVAVVAVVTAVVAAVVVAVVAAVLAVPPDVETLPLDEEAPAAVTYGANRQTLRVISIIRKQSPYLGS